MNDTKDISKPIKVSQSKIARLMFDGITEDCRWCVILRDPSTGQLNYSGSNKLASKRLCEYLKRKGIEVKK